MFVERQGVLVDRLVRLVREDENAMRFRNLIEESERNLEKISVVSEWVVGLIHEIEGMGGVAKISGAGGRTKESGLLLVWHEDRDLVKKWAESNGLGILS